MKASKTKRRWCYGFRQFEQYTIYFHKTHSFIVDTDCVAIVRKIEQNYVTDQNFIRLIRDSNDNLLSNLRAYIVVIQFS